MRTKRSIKKLMRSNGQNEILKKRRELVNQHIYDEGKRRYAEKIQKTVEQLRKNGGGMNIETFWEVRRKLNGHRDEPKTAMKVFVVPILQIMASDGGDEDTEGADAADGGCEGVMGNGSNFYDYER